MLVVDPSGRLRLVAATGRTLDNDGSVLPLPVDGPGGVEIGRALRGGGAMLLPELSDLGPGRTGPHSMLVVPLHYESRVTGLICLVAQGGRRFDDDDVRLIQILSDQAAVAIENARLLHGRDELVHELAGLLEISEAAGAAGREPTLAALLAARLRRETNTDAALVARWDDGSTRAARAVSRRSRRRRPWRSTCPSPPHAARCCAMASRSSSRSTATDAAVEAAQLRQHRRADADPAAVEHRRSDDRALSSCWRPAFRVTRRR